MSLLSRKISTAVYKCVMHDKLVVGIAKAIYHEFGSGDPCYGTTFKRNDTLYSRDYVLSHLQNRPPKRF